MRTLRFVGLLPALIIASVSGATGQTQQGSAPAEGKAGQRGAPAQGGQAAQPSNPAVPQVKAQKFFSFGTNWVAVSLNGKAFSGERPSFIIFPNTTMQGFGGCNSFSSIGYALPSSRQQVLAVAPINSTKKTCDKATMASETAFFRALRFAQQWDQQGSTLIVKSPNGELRFEKAL
jgi:heat shock protein HslJ